MHITQWCKENIKVNICFNCGQTQFPSTISLMQSWSARTQGLQKTSMLSIERSFQTFYLLNTRTICALFHQKWTQCIDRLSLFLQRYVRKDKNAKKTQQFSAFVCYRKNSVECSAFAVARKVWTDCFCRNLPISNDPVVRILRKLSKYSSEITWKKPLNFEIGNF